MLGNGLSMTDRIDESWFSKSNLGHTQVYIMIAGSAGHYLEEGRAVVRDGDTAGASY